MRLLPFALAATMTSAAVAAAVAQPAPGAAPPPPPGDAAAPPPPPPPPGPRGDRPPPPPPGASIELDRGGPTGTRVVVRCTQNESTQDCAAVATSLLAKIDAAPAK